MGTFDKVPDKKIEEKLPKGFTRAEARQENFDGKIILKGQFFDGFERVVSVDDEWLLKEKIELEKIIKEHNLQSVDKFIKDESLCNVSSNKHGYPRLKVSNGGRSKLYLYFSPEGNYESETEQKYKYEELSWDIERRYEILEKEKGEIKSLKCERLTLLGQDLGGIYKRYNVDENKISEDIEKIKKNGGIITHGDLELIVRRIS